ncbi:GNAT family N-acetyltransferase [Brevibacterium casei]|uniref:GNAT family N-acetyltransferase n=1 Tax=Brevibacterium casei TaxID=33889 RepID=UPI00223B27C5|nr:GNAT family N-acetyltransferase [Brevibacterium casei]MCT2357598.1 GNAT family N-acetyltransferase [Brevibacterium casei]
MTAQWKVLWAEAATDREEWIGLWSTSAERHPFAHPDVCSLLRAGDGQLAAAVMTAGDGHVLYPFFLREIDAELTAEAGGDRMFDIISPYGYGGPLHWGISDIDAASAQFWRMFDLWADENSVVSEFSRLTLFTETMLPYQGTTRRRQTNYVRDLSVPADDLGQKVAPKVRSNVLRALREGVTTVIDTEGEFVDDFVRIYTETMERRESADWYRFERPFFEGIHAALPGQFAYVYAQHEGRLVSVDLLLFGREDGYYFLGGTEAAAFGVRPNDLVKMESMKWLQAQGRRRYVLGGGVTAEDSLERYKRGFALEGQYDYFTGERILSPGRYEELLEAHRHRLAANGLDFDEASDFFPAYRRGAEALSPREPVVRQTAEARS